MARLWIRTVAGPAIGIGHVMRCLAVAQAARRAGWDATFVLHQPEGSAIVERFGFQATGIHDDGRSWLDGVGQTDAILFDGYAFTRRDLAEGREAAAVAVIEDRVGVSVAADLLVNPNPVPPPPSPAARVLLGPAYALIRDDARARSPRPRDGHLLLTFGGSDPAGAAAVAVRILAGRRDVSKVVLVRGPLAPPVTSAHSWLEVVTDPPAMAPLYAGATAAISAAGSTTWELLHAGVPTALVEVADNQRVVREGLAASGTVVDLGLVDHLEDMLPAGLDLLADPVVRSRLSARGSEVVDGRGPDRVVAAIAHAVLARTGRAPLGDRAGRPLSDPR